MIFEQPQDEEDFDGQSFQHLNKFLRDSYCLYLKQQGQKEDGSPKEALATKVSAAPVDPPNHQVTVSTLDSQQGHIPSKAPIKNSKKLGFKATQLLCEILQDQEAYEGQYLSNATIEQIAQLRQESQTIILEIIKFSLVVRSVSSGQAKELIAAFADNVATGEKTTNKPLSMDNVSQYMPQKTPVEKRRIPKNGNVPAVLVRTMYNDDATLDGSSTVSDESFGASIVLPKSKNKVQETKFKETPRQKFRNSKSNIRKVSQDIFNSNKNSQPCKTLTGNTVYLDASPKSSIRSQSPIPNIPLYVTNMSGSMKRNGLTQQADDTLNSKHKQRSHSQSESMSNKKEAIRNGQNLKNLINKNIHNKRSSVLFKNMQQYELSNNNNNQEFKNEAFQHLQNIMSLSNVIDSRGVNLNSQSMEYSEKINQIPTSLTQSHLMKFQQSQSQQNSTSQLQNSKTQGGRTQQRQSQPFKPGMLYDQVQINSTEDGKGKKQQGFKIKMPQPTFSNELQAQTDKNIGQINILQEDKRVDSLNKLQSRHGPATFSNNHNTTQSSFKISPPDGEPQSLQFNPFRSVANLLKSSNQRNSRKTYYDNPQPVQDSQHSKTTVPKSQQINHYNSYAVNSSNHNTSNQKSGDINMPFDRTIFTRTTDRRGRNGKAGPRGPKGSSFMMKTYDEINNKENKSMHNNGREKHNAMKFNTMSNNELQNKRQQSGNFFKRLLRFHKSKQGNASQSTRFT